MNERNNTQLERAKAHFYSWRFTESYNILRLYFSRLPFQPEREHAEYIGIFTRVLAELGKSRELEFYMLELERLHRRTPTPLIAFQLAMVYRNLPQPRIKETIALLEKLVSDPSAKEYQIKAKMMLAHCYDWLESDTKHCREIIDSIEDPEERDLKIMLDLWRAKLDRDEGKPKKALLILNSVLDELMLPHDWYLYFSAKILLADLYLGQRNLKAAQAHLVDIRDLLTGRRFRAIEIQVEALEKRAKEAGLNLDSQTRPAPEDLSRASLRRPTEVNLLGL